ncbi:MAG: hypothetical protein ABSB28_07660 [Candidatus Bathyarchaeia archaeon]
MFRDRVPAEILVSICNNIQGLVALCHAEIVVWSGRVADIVQPANIYTGLASYSDGSAEKVNDGSSDDDGCERLRCVPPPRSVLL